MLSNEQVEQNGKMKRWKMSASFKVTQFMFAFFFFHHTTFATWKSFLQAIMRTS